MVRALQDGCSYTVIIFCHEALLHASQHFSGTHPSRFRFYSFVHARTSIPFVSPRDPFHVSLTRRAESERFHCVQPTRQEGQDDTGQARYSARQRTLQPRIWMLEICRGYCTVWRGAEQSTDRRCTATIICGTRRGLRTEHLARSAHLSSPSLCICCGMPSSALIHIIQAHAQCSQDPCL